MKPQTKDEAIAVLKACDTYESIDLQDDGSGTLCGTHPNGLPARIVRSGEAGWFEVHGGICNTWLNVYGGPTGRLGLPISNEDKCPGMGEGVRISHFQKGCLWWSPKDGEIVQCCFDETSLELELTHNPLTIETELSVFGHPCKDDWFRNLVGDYDAPRRLQMWVDHFFPTFRKAFPFAKSATLKFRGVAFDCEDIQQVAIDAKQDGFPLNLTTEECKSAEDKYKRLLSLYEEAQRLEYKPFEKVQALFQQIENRVFNIGVVGPMKNGKSTLLNAIIGQDLLPTDEQSCTHKIWYVEHDPKSKGFEAKREAESSDEASTQSTGNKGFLPADPDLLRQWNQDESDKRGFTLRGRLANIHVPNNYKLTFVDTPGPDSAIFTADAEEVEYFFEEDRASMMFCVYNYSNEAQRESLKRVKAKLEKFGRQIEDRMVFIVPRLDQIPIGETDTAENNRLSTNIQTIKVDLNTFGFKNPKIILVSAKIALDVRLFPAMMKRAVLAKRSGDMGLLNRLRAIINERIKEFEVFCSQFERMGTTSMDIASISSSVRDPLVREYDALCRSAASRNYESLLRRCEILSGVPALEKCVEEYLVKYLIPARVHEAAEEFRKSIRLADLESLTLVKIREDNSAKAKLEADLKKIEDLESSGRIIAALKKKVPKHAGFPGNAFKQEKNDILNEVKGRLKAIKDELDNALSEDNDRLEVGRATELRKWLEGELCTTIQSNRSAAESALTDEMYRFSDKVRELCNNALSDVLADSQFLKELFQQQLVARPHLNWSIRSFDLDSLIKERKMSRTVTRRFNRLREGVSGFFSYVFHGFSSIRKQMVTETIEERFVLKDDFRSECKDSIASARKLFADVLSDDQLNEVLKPVSQQFLLEVDNFFSDASRLRNGIDLFTDKLKTTEQARAKHEATLNRVRRLGDQLKSLLELEPATSANGLA